MTHYLFNKFESDIFSAYQQLHGSVDLSSNESVSAATHVCNKVLLKICQSYYFKNKYSGFKLMVGVDDNKLSYSYIAAPFKSDLKKFSDSELADKSNYFIQNGLFIEHINQQCNHFNKSFSIAPLLDEKTLPLISMLKLDSYYAKIFEESPLKQQLLLKSKNNLKLTVLAGNITLEVLKSFLKEQHIDSSQSLYDYMNINSGISFINLERQKDQTWFIYHNDEDIAALGTLMNNPFIHNIPDTDKFKYLGFIAVNYDFRGQQLGVKVTTDILNHCSHNNYIYERSSATNDGQLYLEKNLNNLCLQYNNKLPIIKDTYGQEMKDFIQKIFKEPDSYLNARSILMDKIKDLQIIEQDKGRLYVSDLKKTLKINKKNSFKI